MPHTEVRFPEHFRFGVANADHQVEAYRKQGEDVWDLWERCQNLTPRGRGVEFWERYEEDIERAANLGCKIFRFSISWARTEPEPEQWDEEALNHYRKVAEKVREHGMELMVTLVHFTWPIWLEQQKGLLGPAFPEKFANYAQKMAHTLGDLVNYWVTLNEPTQLVFGYIKPWWQNRYYMPPGLPKQAGAAEQAEAIGKLIPNLFRAHARARTSIQEIHPKAKVGANPLVTGFPSWLQTLMDAQAGWGWLTQAMYRFSMAAPLVSERAKVDLVLGEIDLEENTTLNYTQPYAYTGKALLVKSDSPHNTIQDLAGKSIGIINSGNAKELAQGHLPHNSTKHLYPETHTAKEALAQGTIEAIYGDEFLMASPNDFKEAKFRFLAKGLTRESYAAAVPPGHQGLLTIINNVIIDTRCEIFGECTYKEITQKDTTGLAEEPLSLADYFAGTERNHLPHDGEGLRRIRRRGYLVVGIRADAPGISPNTPEKGLEYLLAEQVAEAIFGDRTKLKMIPLAGKDRFKVLKTRTRFINKLWHYTAAVGLISNSNWWYLGTSGKLSKKICPPEAIGAQDYVGLDYYWGLPTNRLHKINSLVDAGEGRFKHAPVWPKGLRLALQRYHRWFPKQELLIIENGCVPLAGGVTREEYLQAHLQEVSNACAKGIPISAYLCWSLTSNREWGHPFSEQTDFGLYHVALDTDPSLTRKEQKGAAFYRNLIQSAKKKKPLSQE